MWTARSHVPLGVLLSSSPAVRRSSWARRRRRRSTLVPGERADVVDELQILPLQQRRQQRAEVFASAPFAHVVGPGLPAARLFRRHLALVEQDVRALEQRDQYVEDDQHSFALLRAQIGGLDGGKQPQVRVVQRDLQEVLIVVGQELVDLFIVAVALLL